MKPYSNIHPYVIFSCQVEQGTLVFSNAVMYTDDNGIVTISVGDVVNVYLIPPQAPSVTPQTP